MKYFLPLIAVCAVSFSCSHSDDKSTYNPFPTPTLIGKWHQKNTEVDGIVTPYEDHETCGKDYIEFYGLNQVRSVDIFGCEPDIEWEGSYIVFGKELRLSVDGENLTTEIDVLTYTNLSFSYDIDENEDGEVEHHIERFER